MPTDGWEFGCGRGGASSFAGWPQNGRAARLGIDAKALSEAICGQWSWTVTAG